jgi:hypothetical protein
MVLTSPLASNDVPENGGILAYGNEQLLPGAAENQGINFGDLLWNFQWFDANSLWTDNPSL